MGDLRGARKLFFSAMMGDVIGGRGKASFLRRIVPTSSRPSPLSTCLAVPLSLHLVESCKHFIAIGNGNGWLAHLPENYQYFAPLAIQHRTSSVWVHNAAQPPQRPSHGSGASSSSTSSPYAQWAGSSYSLSRRQSTPAA
jgi:hypothetical protein